MYVKTKPIFYFGEPKWGCYHLLGFIKVPDSGENKHVIAEVAGGFCGHWWQLWERFVRQRAHVTIFTYGPPSHDYLRFPFPEGSIVDPLAHLIANLMDRWIECRQQAKRHVVA